MASKQDFINQAYQDAIEAGLAPPQAALAATMASLESAFGVSSPGNAYFGVKAGPSYTGPVQNLMTWEEEGGQRVNQRANFRAYDNKAESLKDWKGVMERNWPAAMSAPTFDEAVEGLGYGRPGGYATDSRYGDKLGTINDRYLGDWAGMSLPEVGPVPYSAIPDLAEDLGPSASMSFAPGATRSDPFSQVMSAPDMMASYRDPAISAPNYQAPAPIDVKTAEIAAPELKSAPSQPFDAGRFGPAAPTPSAPVAFDMQRFGPVEDPAAGLEGLRKGLVEQQLNMGSLPPLSTALQAPSLPANPTTTRAGSAVTNTSSIPSADRSARAQDRTNAAKDTAKLASIQTQDKFATGITKALGGVLGTALLGPIGGILGSFVVPQLLSPITNRAGSFYPTAPSKAAASAGHRRDDGNYGYSGLSSAGRDAYNESGQFADAVDSGKGGLW